MLLMDLDFQLPAAVVGRPWCRVGPSQRLTLSLLFASRPPNAQRQVARLDLRDGLQEFALSLFHGVHALHPEGVLGCGR